MLFTTDRRTKLLSNRLTNTDYKCTWPFSYSLPGWGIIFTLINTPLHNLSSFNVQVFVISFISPVLNNILGGCLSLQSLSQSFIANTM